MEHDVSVFYDFPRLGFDEIISRGHSYISNGDVTNAKKVFYYLLINRLPSSSRDQCILYSLLVEILVAVTKFDVDYEILEYPVESFETELSNAFFVRISFSRKDLVSLLDIQKYPYVDRVGLTPLIKFLLPNNENRWRDKELFMKGYILKSLVNFGRYEGKTVNEILDISPYNINEYQENLQHFFIGYDVLLDRRFILMTQLYKLSYFQIALKAFVKWMIAQFYYDFESREKERLELEVAEQERFRKECESAYWDAFENDSSNLWNID